MLSSYQLKIGDSYKYNIPHGKVYDKEKYVLHYEDLQLCLRLGSKLKRIHRISEFNQSL